MFAAMRQASLRDTRFIDIFCRKKSPVSHNIILGPGHSEHALGWKLRPKFRKNYSDSSKKSIPPDLASLPSSFFQPTPFSGALIHCHSIDTEGLGNLSIEKTPFKKAFYPLFKVTTKTNRVVT
jgi:hypothetical protein